MALSKADTAESQFNAFGWPNREARSDVDPSEGWGLLGKRALTNAPLSHRVSVAVVGVRRFVLTLLSALLVGCGGDGSGRQQPPLNEAPVFTSSTTATVNENQTAADTAVATYPDDDALTYRLEGTDALFFDIDVRDLQVSNSSPV